MISHQAKVKDPDRWTAEEAFITEQYRVDRLMANEVQAVQSFGVERGGRTGKTHIRGDRGSPGH